MNRITINLEALCNNFRVVSDWVDEHSAKLTVVTKALCGHAECLEALHAFGVQSVGDSRIENLRAIRQHMPEVESWCLRPPHMSALKAMLPLCDVSLNSDLETIQAVSTTCQKASITHQIVLMVELGDLREGVLPGKLLDMIANILQMPNIKLVGLGANLGCLSGAIPMSDELAQISLYHELIELKYGISIPYVSAGTSAGLRLLLAGELPASINHFRVGEAILLGTDPVTGGVLSDLRNDVVTLEAEVVEVKEKKLVASIETVGTAFEAAGVSDEEAEPGQRGFRALVTVGHVDTDINGLTPLHSDISIAGASSDVTVLNLPDNDTVTQMGKTVSFRPDYSAFVRLMNNPYTEKILTALPQEE